MIEVRPTDDELKEQESNEPNYSYEEAVMSAKMLAAVAIIIAVTVFGLLFGKKLRKKFKL